MDLRRAGRIRVFDIHGSGNIGIIPLPFLSAHPRLLLSLPFIHPRVTGASEIAESTVTGRFIVIGKLLVEGSTQLTSVEGDQVVEAFTEQGPDDPLYVAVLPRAAIGQENLPNPSTVHRFIEVLAEFLVLVADEFALFEGKHPASLESWTL